VAQEPTDGAFRQNDRALFL